MKALVIDDESDTGLIVSNILIKEGYEADYTGFIDSARQMIKSKEYTLFVVDLNLPDGSGFELILDIKKNNSNAKILIISAFDGKYEINKARSLGVTDFIRKPFSKEYIIDIIRNYT